MANGLTDEEKKFVKNVVKTGNATQSVIKAFPNITDKNYAGVKGHELLRKPKIIKVVKSIAERIPDEELLQVHKEGLHAMKVHGSMTEPDRIVDDYPTRHKYLDTAYKLKGSYAPEKTINLEVKTNIKDLEKYQDLARKYEAELLKTIQEKPVTETPL
ncbi:MAG TPA: terminase small subunit [Patescibacteria group bacterium]